MIRKYKKFAGNSDEVLQALNKNKDWFIISITNNGEEDSFFVFYYTEEKGITPIEPIKM